MYLCVFVYPSQSKKGRSCSSQREVTVVLPNGQYVMVRCDTKSKARDVFDMVVAHANLVEHFYFGLAFIDGRKIHMLGPFFFAVILRIHNYKIFFCYEGGFTVPWYLWYTNAPHVFIYLFMYFWLKKDILFCRWWILLFGPWNKNLQSCSWQLEKRADWYFFGLSEGQIFCRRHRFYFVSPIFV